MFKIYEFRYVDVETKTRWVFYARDVSLADSLASRISKLGIYNLKRKRFFFCRNMVTDIPPYELEQAQIEYIEQLEEKKRQLR